MGREPYHVTRGYALNDNTVTAASALTLGIKTSAGKRTLVITKKTAQTVVITYQE